MQVEGYGTFEVPLGKRLVNAIEDSGVDILHRCGGNAKCTTCRVEFVEGEPGRRTTAELDRLMGTGLEEQVRLSCQCQVEGDMKLKVLQTLSNSNLEQAGSRPADEITPEPEWIPLEVSV